MVFLNNTVFVTKDKTLLPNWRLGKLSKWIGAKNIANAAIKTKASTITAHIYKRFDKHASGFRHLFQCTFHHVVLG